MVNERDTQVVAVFVDLVVARRREDYSRAASAQAELDRLGVRVRFKCTRVRERAAADRLRNLGSTSRLKGPGIA